MGHGSHYVAPVPDSIHRMLLPTELLAPALGVSSAAYAILAVWVARSTPQNRNNLVSFFLFLIAGMVAGSAFSYGATDATLYGIGRTLSFCSAGFIPIAFYLIYREFTVGRPHTILIVMLAIIPVATTILAMTNSQHHMIWMATETETGLQFSELLDHYWYKRIHAPFTYGLFGYSMVALLGRLPTLALAHRKMALMLALVAAVPFLISAGNTILGIGPQDIPFTTISLALMFPAMAYVSLKLRLHEFSPVAYQTLFDHVRDPIFVIDNDQRIICANKAAQQLLEGEEHELIGRKLWEDFPAARAILEQARELDLTQTLRMDTNNIF